MTPWDTLGIAPTNDIRAIKKAYSIKLKTTRPDDDAVAYQQLREAYEAAQQWGPFVASLESGGLAEEPADPLPEAPQPVKVDVLPEDADITPAAEPVAPAEPVVPVIAPAPLLEPWPSAEEEVWVQPQGPTVERLLQTCAAILEQGGELHLVRMWPGLQQQLDDLPIAAHQEASRGFAAFAVQQDVPVEVLIALTRYFQWGLDYRVDTQLGHELSLALQSRLQLAHVYVALNGQTEPGDTWALALAKLSDKGRTVWLRLLAVCMDHSTRQRVAQTSPLRLQALGASKRAGQAAVAAAALGGIGQALLFLVLFIVAAHGLFALSGSYIKRQEWQFTGGWVALLLGTYSYLYREVPYVDYWWLHLRQKLRAKGWILDGLALVPWAVAALLPLVVSPESLDSVDVLFPVSLVYFALWLVVPTDEQSWRKLFLPTFVFLLVGLSGFFPQLSHATVLGIALGWTLVAHVVLRRYSLVFETIYQGFGKMGVLKGVLRERPFLIFGIKFIGAAWLLYVLTCLPAFLFRLCAQSGLLFAQLAMLGGVLFSAALHPASPASWLLACTLAAVFAIQSMQWGLQKCADFVLPKLKS